MTHKTLNATMAFETLSKVIGLWQSAWHLMGEISYIS
jgi:hypothetical protein